jgi:hypothetical protein
MTVVNQTLEMIERVSAFKGNGGGSWWEPLVTEGARAIGSIAPHLPAIFAARANAAGASTIITPVPNPAFPASPSPGGAITPPLGPAPAAVTQQSQTTDSDPPAPSTDQLPPIQPGAATPSSDPSTPAPGQMPGSSIEDQLPFIKRQALEFLMPMAFANDSPQLWVDVAMAEMDRGNIAIARVLGELNTAKDFDIWFADLKKIDPSIVSVQAWFSDFYKGVRDSLAELEAENGKA